MYDVCEKKNMYNKYVQIKKIQKFKKNKRLRVNFRSRVVIVVEIHDYHCVESEPTKRLQRFSFLIQHIFASAAFAHAIVLHVDSMRRRTGGLVASGIKHDSVAFVAKFFFEKKKIKKKILPRSAKTKQTKSISVLPNVKSVD